ncbi:MAG: S8 family peptidase [Casimicrobiaceae bacterium]
MPKPLPAMLALGALLLAPPPVHAQSPAPIPTARVIVKYRADSALLQIQAPSPAEQRAGRVQALGARVGMALRAGAGVSERTHVVFARGMTSEALAQRLSAESDVEYAVPDRRRRIVAAPNDPLYLAGPPVGIASGGPAVGQWYLRAPAGEVQSSINVEPAWDYAPTSTDIVVADIDTGARFDHPDLKQVAAGGHLLPGYDMVSDLAAANDGDGRDTDASDPGDWITEAETDDPSGEFYQCGAQDSSWHGTQTAGLIGALTNNGVGMASVTRIVRVLPVRVLGKCGGFDSDIIAGMLWAAGLTVPGAPVNPTPARVLNMSLGGEGACPAPYIDALAEINAAGAVVVASAGNSSGHAAGTPANCPGVIAVTGLRHAGSKVGFADIGPAIALAAPAGNCVNVDPGSACLYPVLTTANAGLTAPIPDAAGGSIYTDGFNASVGTSFSAPMVTGTVALMLAADPTLTAAAVRSLLQANARPFPATGLFNSDGTPVAQCLAPQPIGERQTDQLECYCTQATCGAGMLDAGNTLAAVIKDRNYGGLWWNAPGGSEAGWGINFAHQGGTIFASWFTYDSSGKAWWLVMSAGQTAPNSYSGALYQATGPAFDAVPFPPIGNPGGATGAAVGTGTLTFSDANDGTFAYTVNGISQTKAITRQTFGPLPLCTFGQQVNLALTGNYQDLWWAAPAGSEAGWGVNLTHEGDIIFATWFTYDTDHTPMWLVATAAKSGRTSYSGDLTRLNRGPPFNSVPFPPIGAAGGATGSVVGSAEFAFFDGNSGTFTYTVNGETQTKNITREVFTAPGTVCH